MTLPSTFDEYRLEATKRFAHTLIVVDDEASTEPRAMEPEIAIAALKKPTRAESVRSATKKDAVQLPDTTVSHPLNAAALTETSMSLGLICSILKPKPNDRPAATVAKAAMKADILCIDWEMHKDSGETAKAIVNAVLENDEKNGGRLRLIAIYTGVPDKEIILKALLSSIAVKVRERRGIAIRENYLISNDGLRIAWLLKKGGTPNRKTAKYAISEDELPQRLQKEFSYLSEGVLTNVAIATIASIREATHHVLARFKGSMDGPYFRHRSTLTSPEDAEEYATQIIVSELKNSIDGNKISSDFAGGPALQKALDYVLNSKDQIFVSGQNNVTVPYDRFSELIVNGISPTFKKYNNLGIGKNPVLEQIGYHFSKDKDTSIENMLEFAALTCLSAQSASRYTHHKPMLSLGSIVQDGDKNYLLCVQASCDSVRLKKPQAFLFAQLETVPRSEIWGAAKDKIEFVVPVATGSSRKRELVCLKLSDKAPYAALRSIVFPPTSEERVFANKNDKDEFHFTALNIPGGKRSPRHKLYNWIADVKRKRALRTVQYIGQEMGRIGFDEFEAFRRDY